MKPITVILTNPRSESVEMSDHLRACRAIILPTASLAERRRTETRVLMASARARQAAQQAAKRVNECALKRWRRAANEGRAAAHDAARAADRRERFAEWRAKHHVPATGE